MQEGSSWGGWVLARTREARRPSCACRRRRRLRRRCWLCVLEATSSSPRRSWTRCSAEPEASAVPGAGARSWEAPRRACGSRWRRRGSWVFSFLFFFLLFCGLAIVESRLSSPPFLLVSFIPSPSPSLSLSLSLSLSRGGLGCCSMTMNERAHEPCVIAAHTPSSRARGCVLKGEDEVVLDTEGGRQRRTKGRSRGSLSVSAPPMIPEKKEFQHCRHCI